MLNIIWAIMIIISIIFAILNGRIEYINNSIFNYSKLAVEISISLLGTMCLWNGLMNIAIKTKIVDKLSNILHPIIKRIFPDIKKEEKTYREITMNIVANIMGIGNAATALGLKAMKSLQEKNEDKSKLSNSMAMLIVLNTASIQIIPTTVIAIRASMESKNPTMIILPIWIATTCGAIAAILSAKLLMRKF